MRVQSAGAGLRRGRVPPRSTAARRRSRFGRSATGSAAAASAARPWAQSAATASPPACRVCPYRFARCTARPRCFGRTPSPHGASPARPARRTPSAARRRQTAPDAASRPRPRRRQGPGWKGTRSVPPPSAPRSNGVPGLAVRPGASCRPSAARGRRAWPTTPPKARSSRPGRWPAENNSPARGRRWQNRGVPTGRTSYSLLMIPTRPKSARTRRALRRG